MYVIIMYVPISTDCCLVLAVLKKNYTRLCHCLPQNYMKTISKLKLDSVLSKFPKFLLTAGFVNDRIVQSLMVTIIKSDVQALKFCDRMDTIVDSESSKRYVEILRIGE